MIIDSSKIGMESARRYTSATFRAVKYTVGRGGSTSNELFDHFLPSDKEESQDVPSDSKKSTDKNREYIDSQWRSMINTDKIRKASPRENASPLAKLRQQCLMYILDILYRCREKNPSSQTISEENPYNVTSLMPAEPVTLYREVSKVSFAYESEETAFSTAGQVKTADGRTIDFQMDIYMSREFSSYFEETELVRATSFMDPLVINLDASPATISDQKFYFDLDSDGEKELISGLGPGSGYIALDKNGNGIIDDGSELFGTASGDGFKDLLAYDEDHNGWIDENDSIWSKLLIWTGGEDGEQELYHLKDKGVGALCLSRVSTDFSLNDTTTNATNARIRSTGIFLYENGNVGSMQQLDLAN